ncbi:serine proteinase stubble-like isoform X2 [Homarus americanus]|uniref:serine proteinase stubble-like isoform X2 n=1 Tax=Homarus americanus TaxID=6706 RepID=UPI001C43DAA2|nr:serine proteinase stubble-like isoform X2 [Homarus americanus]
MKMWTYGLGMARGGGIEVPVLLLTHLLHTVTAQNFLQLQNPIDWILFTSLGYTPQPSAILSLRTSAPEICTLPDGQQGSCQLLSACQAYQHLTDDIPKHLDLFRTLVCRLTTESIHLCCPLNINHQLGGTTTQPPSKPSSTFQLQSGSVPRPQSPQGRPSQEASSKPLTLISRTDEHQSNTNTSSQSALVEPIRNSPQSTSDIPIQPSPVPPGQSIHIGSVQPSFIFPGQASQGLAGSGQENSVNGGGKLPLPDHMLPGHSEALPTTLPPNSPILPLLDECGVWTANTTVVDGGKWPWLAALGQFQGSQFEVACGGALVTRRSHVQLGGYEAAVPKYFSILHHIDAGFNIETFENDTAIVTLSQDVIFDDFIQPVCLPFRFKYDGFRYQNLDVVGWTPSSDAGDGRTQLTSLQDSRIPVIGLDSCRNAYQASRNSLIINHNQLCTSGGSLTTCVSDKGAPLFYFDEDSTKRYYVVGLVSYGYGCAKPNEPGVFTRVGAFIEWIEQILK